MHTASRSSRPSPTKFPYTDSFLCRILQCVFFKDASILKVRANYTLKRKQQGCFGQWVLSAHWVGMDGEGDWVAGHGEISRRTYWGPFSSRASTAHVQRGLCNVSTMAVRNRQFLLAGTQPQFLNSNVFKGKGGALTLWDHQKNDSHSHHTSFGLSYLKAVEPAGIWNLGVPEIEGVLPGLALAQLKRCLEYASPPSVFN